MIQQLIMMAGFCFVYDGLKSLLKLKSKADKENERKIAAVRADLAVMQKTMSERLKPATEKNSSLLAAWNSKKGSEK